MKILQKLAAGLLSLSMLLGFTGCIFPPSAPPAVEAPPEITEPAAPIPLKRYREAREAVLSMENLRLNVEQKITRKLGAEDFTTSSEQIILYQGLGTPEFSARVTDTTLYSRGDSVKSKTYFCDGAGYVALEDAVFDTKLTAEAFTGTYLPSVLLDEALYGDVSEKETAKGTILTFSSPTAPESWLFWEGADLNSVTATAVLDQDGLLTETSYTVCCTTAGISTELSFSVKPEPFAGTLDIPKDVSEFSERSVPVPGLEFPVMLLHAAGFIRQSHSITADISSVMISDYYHIRNTSEYHYNSWGISDAMVSKLDYTDAMSDLDGNILDYLKNGDSFADSTLTMYRQDEEPEEAYATPEWMHDYLTTQLTKPLPALSLIRELGVVETRNQYLILYTLTSDGAIAFRDRLCAQIYGDDDPMSMATDYETTEMNGYLSIDKLTGLPVSLGSDYSGTFTIDGEPSTLSHTYVQSLYLASNTAYQAVTGEPLPNSEPREKATPLFYKVTGTEGQQMWLLGTIHVGDSRTSYLPKELYDALDTADALAVEFDILAYDEAVSTDPDMLESILESYFYTDGTRLKDHLDPELYEVLMPTLVATGNFDASGTAELMRPTVLCSMLENSLLRQSYSLTSSQGVDRQLLLRAKEMDKKILDIESGEFQLEMLTGYSDAVQEMLLANTLSVHAADYANQLQEMFSLWCAGNEAALRASVQEDTADMPPEMQDVYQEYNQAMLVDRNAGMLRTAQEYLESGDVVFYAVGLAHLLAEDGLVNTLRAAGYTVEPVRYR